MTLPHLLQNYLTLNILLAVSFASFRLVDSLSKRNKIYVPSPILLRIYYGVLIGAIALASFQGFIPQNTFFTPTAKIWSAESSQTFYSQYRSNSKIGYLTLDIAHSPISINTRLIASIATILMLFIFLGGLLYLANEIRLLIKVRNKSFLFKRIGSTAIYLNDQVLVPFSFRLGHACIIVPSSLIENQKYFRIAIAHELQHHRQGDTITIYFLWLLRILFFANPFSHALFHQIIELQEFACDEALIGRKKAESQTYARCLLEVAQSALNQKSGPKCAMGLTFMIDRLLLTRRVEKMFKQKSLFQKPQIGALCFVLGFALSITTFASTNLFRDRRITMREAQQLAEKTKLTASFPIVVNDLVLKELNRYLGTPDGRDFMKKSLTRKEIYQSLLDRKFEEYQIPDELMAVPIIESGFQNLPQSENKSWGAGLWMFIESTARNYGLRVDAVVDERLNPELLTDAALRYISSNYYRFKDYQLALLGYNIGEKKVQEGINRLGTRDAWVLTRNGYDGDKYLSRLMAAILIMKNPESLD